MFLLHTRVRQHQTPSSALLQLQLLHCQHHGGSNWSMVFVVVVVAATALTTAAAAAAIPLLFIPLPIEFQVTLNR